MSLGHERVDRDRDVVNLEVSVDDKGCLVLQYASNAYRHARLATHYRRVGDRGINNIPRRNCFAFLKSIGWGRVEPRKRVVRLLDDDQGMQISGIDVKNIKLEDGSYSVKLGTLDDADFLSEVLNLPGMSDDDTSSVLTFRNSHIYHLWYIHVSDVGEAHAQVSGAI